MASSNKRRTIIFIAVAVVIIAAGIALLSLYQKSVSLTADPLTLVPSTAQFVIHVDLLSILDENPLEIVGRWKNSDPFRYLRKIVQEKMNLDIDEDFLSWAGPRMCCAAILQGKSDKESQQVLVAASVRDREELTKTIARIETQLREKDNTTYKKSTYMGGMLYTPSRSDRPILFLYRHFFLICNSEELLNAAIKAANGTEEGIAKTPSWQEAMESLPAHRLFTIYFNSRDGNGSREALIRSIGASITKVDREGSLIAEGNICLLKSKKAPEGTGSSFKSLDMVPDSTSFLCVFTKRGGNGLNRLLAKCLKMEIEFLPLKRFESFVPSSIKAEDLGDERAIIFDTGSLIGRAMAGDVPKSINQIPFVMILKLNEKMKKDKIASLFGGLESRKYGDSLIFSGDSTLLAYYDNNLLVSRNGADSLLMKIIDEKSAAHSFTDKAGFKMLQTRHRGKDLLLMYGRMADIAFPLKILGTMNPGIREISDFAGSYQGIWVWMSGERDRIRASIYLENR